MFGRIFLMLLGFFLIYLGSKNVLEPLLMIPMGLGMSSVNAGVMFLEGGKMGTLFVDPLMSDPIDLMNIMQIDWLQPIYTLTFSNGLIACLVFMGIGVLLDVGYVMARPFQSIFIALFAELGTIAVFPIAVGWALIRARPQPSPRSAAPTGRWCCSPRWYWPRICSCRSPSSAISISA
jgi:Na+-transporting methylmalonyl-CoA/oxaloacetate decarboxylase beta subunit